MESNIYTTSSLKPTGSINWFSKIAGLLFLIISLAVFLIIGIPGKQDNLKTVTFSLEAPEAHSVALLGDFNNWEASQLKKKNGRWEIIIKLQRGKSYTYNFLLDGKEMITDPKSGSIDDNFGSESSIIEVK